MRGRPPIKINVGSCFGRLTVLRREGRYHGSHGYLCRCTCGKQKVAGSSALKHGHVVSCGCFNRERISAKRTDARQRLFTHFLASAKERAIPCELSYGNFVALIGKNCHYCGDPPAPRTGKRWAGLAASGIDRVDNRRGYTLENCVTSCAACNFAKLNLTLPVFLNHVAKICRHSRS